MTSSLLTGGVGLVLVEFPYEYEGRDGAMVSIKPNERYVLLAKTNDHWWHVTKDPLTSRPFYIPAKYVRELPGDPPSPLDLPPTSVTSPTEPPAPLLLPVAVPGPKTSHRVEEVGSTKNVSRTKPGDEVTIRVRSDARRRTENRMSTFGVPLELQDLNPNPLELQDLLLPLATPPPAFAGGGDYRPVSPPTAVAAVDDIGTTAAAAGRTTNMAADTGSRRASLSPVTPPTVPVRNHAHPIAVETPVVPAMPSVPAVPAVPAVVPVMPSVPAVPAVPSVTVTPAVAPVAVIPSVPSVPAVPAVVPVAVPSVPAMPAVPVMPVVPIRDSSIRPTEGPEISTSPQKETQPEDDIPEELIEDKMGHIYESIQDLNIDLEALTAGRQEDSVTAATSQNPDPVETPVEKTDPDAETQAPPIYANVSDLRRSQAVTMPPTAGQAPSSPYDSASSSDLTPSSSVSSPGVISPTFPLSPQDGWQVFTDKDSGKEFYHHPVTGRTTWTHPPSLQDEMEQAGPAHSPVQGWSVCVDESSGRLFYYNHSSGLTSWMAPPTDTLTTPTAGWQAPPIDAVTTPTSPDRQEPPPLPEEDYPTDDLHDPEQVKPVAGWIPRPPVERGSTAAGWNQTTDAEGKTMYTSTHTQQQWIKGVDERGKPYYYLRDGSKSLWSLPELPAAPGLLMPPRIVGNGVDKEGSKVRNWRHSMAPGEHNKFVPRHRRNLSDSSSPEKGHVSLEKAGILNKTKTADNGKRVRKNWGQSWTVLHGGILTFHKDPKTTPSGTSSKSIQIPEYTVDLRGSTVCWAWKDKSSKKNVLELKTRQGCEYLVQYDTDSIINDWHKVLLESIKQLDQEHVSEEEEEEEEEDGASSDKEDTDRKRSSTRSTSDSEQGRVRSKLKRFLQRRPTLQSVKEKGYIRDNVFGCHLDTLCHRENTTVPKFVCKCIKTIEKRGLDVDGIYRVSGNLAVIQRLRHKADHEDNLNLDDGQWDEIHVITGALKLFFRELPEPLFPFSSFDKFISAIQLPEYNQRVSYMKDLVRTLPLPNYKTMEVLFTHLHKVIHHGDSNRMSVQSVAIVFGPTLLRPQTETANPTVYMVFQNQIVELLLNEFHTVFCHSS